MSKHAQTSVGKLTAVTTDDPEMATANLTASTQGRAAGEIADVLVVLRARAQEFDLKFLSYLLEMAYIDAFELSQKDNSTE